MSTTSDYYYNQLFDYLLSTGTKIKVNNDFHGQMTQINAVLKNDYTALISTILDFMVHSATVPINFDTDNDNITELFEKWKKLVNTGIGIDIPRGLRSVTEQYFRERWKSSFIVLNIKWAKLEGYWFPSRMWFTEGASVYVKNNTGNLTATKYYVGKPRKDHRNLLPKRGIDTLIRKPYNSWYDEYPVPYLVKRGALYHALFKQKILEKQAEGVQTLLPYMFWIKAGCEEAMRKGQMPTEEELKALQDKFKDIRNKYDEYVASKGLVGAFPFDVNFEHLVPDLTKLTSVDATKAADKNLLAALGLIELEGFAKSREETILNPKVLVEEVTDAVLDYVELLYDVVALIKQKNVAPHRKLAANKIRVVPGTIKAFITNDMKILYRSWTDRGLISAQSAIEDTTGLDFEVEVERRKKEKAKGIDFTMYPRVIVNQEQYPRDPDIETPEETKEETPEKKKTEKDIETSLEETEVITEPMKSIRKIPKVVREALSKEEQQVFKKAFNECFEWCEDMDAGMREYRSLTYAYNVAKLIMAPYQRNEDLPKSVKVLPSEAQTVWRNIFNQSMARGDSEDVARRKAWAGVKRGWKKNKDEDWVKK